MRIKTLIFIFLLNFSNCFANSLELEKISISLKDFIVLKFDLFMQENTRNVFSGGGVLSVAYQDINYNLKIDEKDNIKLYIVAHMDKNRYTSKKYYPKLSDCNQIRNKIFLNKYGYSFIKQKFNNQINEEVIKNSLEEKIFNISTLNETLKNQLISNLDIKINVIHSRSEKSLSCGGKITEPELALR